MDTIDPHLALDLAETGLLVQDADLRILWVNRHAAELLGVDPDEVTDLTSHDPRWDAIHTDGSPYPGDTHPSAVAVRTGEPVRGAVMGVARARSRERIWLLVSAVPARDEEGRVTGAVTTFANISAARSVQEDLEEMNAHLWRLVEERTHELARTLRRYREADERHRAVIRSMSEGVVVHGTDGQIREANPAAEEILGLSLDQMQGRHPVDPHWGLTDEDGAPLSPAEIPSEYTRRTGDAVRDRVVRVRRPGGEMRWLSVSTDPVRSADDTTFRGVVATFSDITAEIDTRRALEESRTFLKRLMASVPGVLMRSVRDASGEERITFISDDVEAMLGVRAEDIVRDPAPLRDRVHAEDLPRLIDARRSMLERGTGSEVTVRMRGADEEWHWIRVHSAAPTPTDEGTVFHATLFDVTEERRVEKGLRLAQRQEALGVLAGGIAHNFNNMLAVILPSLELAADLGSVEVKETLTDARRAAEGASALVRQLLRLARREASSELAQVELNTLVDEVVALSRRIFSRRIHLELDRPAESLHVLARRDELEQVILNMLINARDAVEGSGDPRIGLRLQRRGRRADLHVADNGCGMNDEVAKRLGQPFFTTKDPGRGTGLGMATALGIVSDLQGSLTWSSPGPGEGAVFTLSLPLIRESAEPVPDPAPVAATVEVVREARVLVVDDEPMVLKSVVRLLRKLVPEIVTAPDGEEALVLLDDQGPFDAALVDFSMPGMDGGELTRALKERCPEMPVFIMTGYVRDAADVADADGVIPKPFSGNELRDVLRPWVLRGRDGG